MADDKRELGPWATRQARFSPTRSTDRQFVARMKRLAAIAIALLCVRWLFTSQNALHLSGHKTSSRFPHPQQNIPNDLTPQISEDSHIMNYEPPANPEENNEIPHLIWQLALGPRGLEGSDRFVNQSATWKELDGFGYKALTDADALAFVSKHYSREPSIVRFWKEVTTMVVRADFLRYLLLYAQGGFYSDMDTTCLENPVDWVPEKYNRKDVNVIMGLERDDKDADKPREFLSPVSFTQWTLASKPGHPIFKIAIRRLMSNIEYLTRMKNKELSEMTGSEFYDKQILAATGPGLMSDILVQHLRDHGHDVNFTSFYHITEPTLFHDVLILPVHGFGANAHVPLVDGQSFVVHHFAGTWKEENNQPVEVAAEDDAMDEEVDPIEEIEEEASALESSNNEEGERGEESKTTTRTTETDKDIEEDDEEDDDEQVAAKTQAHKPEEGEPKAADKVMKAKAASEGIETPDQGVEASEA